MKKKIVLYALCALIAVGSVVPCFATETQAVAIDDTGKADLGTAAVLPGSSTVTPSYTYNYNLDGATVGLESGTTVGLEEGTEVTLSDESVEALADAIVTKQTEAAAASETYTYAYQYEFVLDNGKVFIVDTNESNLLDNYNVMIIGGSAYYLLLNPTFVYYYNTTPYFSSDYSTRMYSLTSFDTVADLQTGVQSGSSLILWSNFHVFDGDGVLLYESDYAPPVEYTVSFVTGFDGISYESQTWTEDFDPGTLSYDGYTFVGWYMDADFTTPYSSDYVPEADFTLYAKWIENGPMDLFHNSLFDALDALFACEPIRYIFALIFLVIIVGLFKSRRSL